MPFRLMRVAVPETREGLAQIAQIRREELDGFVEGLFGAAESLEGVPGRGYRHLEIEAEDVDGRAVPVITYIAQGKEVDGKPSLRYITLIREGARAHGLPENYIRFLEAVEHFSE